MITKMGNQIVEEDGEKRLNKHYYPFAAGNKAYKKNSLLGRNEFIRDILS